MTSIDIDKVTAILKEVAATEVMPRFKNLVEGDIRQKKPGDFVTIADEASEQALSRALTALLPGSVVVGEEAVSKDVSVLNRFDSNAPVWVIDPIDGTYNYAHGYTKFGILLGLVQNGVTTHGWVYDCPGDRMAVAEKGSGATVNGIRTHMRKSALEPIDMAGEGGGMQEWHFDPVRPQVKAIAHVRSSLHNFLSLAVGDADFVVHGTQVTPWDHTPSVLLAEEAGAFVQICGERIPFAPNMLKRCMLIAAADEERWEKLNDVFYKGLRHNS